MDPLQLTSDERLRLSERIRGEFSQSESGGVRLTFERFADVCVIIEYHAESNSLIFSIKVESISNKAPHDLIGSPAVLGDIEEVSIYNICTEINSALASDFNWDVDIGDANFTLYNWETDISWYLYETTVSNSKTA